ncbi:MAG: hypothetical protein ABSD69_02645 [Candidatus Levyibacteriota bacterium]|jgi:uncharacterized membrane protein
MAKSSTKPHFSKKEAINYGFKLAKENLFFFFALFIIVILTVAVISGLRIATLHTPLLSFALWLLQTVIDLVIGIGLIQITLKFIDNKKPKYKDLFYYQPIINYFLVALLSGLIVLGGFILLIIPGIFFAFRLKFAAYLVIDKNLGPVEALKKSWKITRGNVWNLFFLGILLFLINILGFICLIVGLFITIPLSMLATTFVYRKLLLQSKAA